MRTNPLVESLPREFVAIITANKDIMCNRMMLKKALKCMTVRYPQSFTHPVYICRIHELLDTMVSDWD